MPHPGVHHTLSLVSTASRTPAGIKGRCFPSGFTFSPGSGSGGRVGAYVARLGRRRMESAAAPNPKTQRECPIGEFNTVALTFCTPQSRHVCRCAPLAGVQPYRAECRFRAQPWTQHTLGALLNTEPYSVAFHSCSCILYGMHREL